MQPNSNFPAGPPPAYTPTAPPIQGEYQQQPPLPPYSYQSSQPPPPQQPSSSTAGGYPMPPGFKYTYPNYNATTSNAPHYPTVYTTQPASQQRIIVAPMTSDQSIIVVGGCPVCRIGVLQEDFTCLGICCAIVFFPMGLLFCLLLRERRCNNCGAVFG